ncbi:DUF3592 domain-containing protein [Corallococcus sp. EGB]|uniref:DUF3592 domain-containing protein n=1 Tax=Corallococcus sp. EGB TaxID=1521117 RepID=UPI001CBB4DBE|nr:DUF3592 domain-containing protein [Corallococcus sp. EGB]
MLPMNAMLLVVFFVGAPLWLLARMLLQYRLTVKLREEGLHAYGEVVSVRRSLLDWKDNIVEYVFPLPEGGEIQGEYRERRWGLFGGRQSSVGDALEVHYLPDNPHRHQRVGTEPGPLMVVSSLFGAGVFLVLAAIVVMNAPVKKAPAPRGGPTPAGRLRNPDAPRTHGKPIPSRAP